jgi:putative transcriptional regulator
MIEIRLKDLAAARGLSMRDIALRSGVAYNTVKALYRGESERPDLGILDRICGVLDVEVGELLVRVPDDASA